METGPEENLTKWNPTEKSALLSNTEALLSGQAFMGRPLFSEDELFSKGYFQSFIQVNLSPPTFLRATSAVFQIF